MRWTLLVVSLVAAAQSGALGLDSTPRAITIAGDLAYFTRDYPFTLWRTNGTAEGTFAISTKTATLRTSIAPVVASGKVYVIADEDGVPYLYASDGLHDAEVVASFEGMTVSGLSTDGKRAYLFTRSTHIPDCVRMWVSDGTTNGTRIAATLFTDDASGVAQVGEAMLFRIYTGPFEYHGRTNYDLWRTDGTTAGTTYLADIVPSFLPAAGVLFYRKDAELWRTDGTTAGTFLITPDHASIVLANESVAFFLKSGPQHWELWRTDGTREGTTKIRTLVSPFFTPRAVTATHLIGIAEMVDQNGTANVVAAQGDASTQTLATLSMRRQRYGWGFLSPVSMQIGNLLYFMAPTRETNELWRSDGTAEGTFRLATFPVPHEYYSELSTLYVLGDRLLFWANDGVFGYEPWISDGTHEGTKRIENLAPEGVIRGRVTDAATGSPLTDVIIDLYSIPWYDASKAILEASVEVDDRGEYVIEGVYGDSLIVRARTTNGHVSQIHGVENCRDCAITQGKKLTVIPPETVVVDFALSTGGRIAGRVANSQGIAQAGVTIHVATSVNAPDFVTATTAVDGTYETAGIPSDRAWVVYTSNHPGLSAQVFDGASCAAGCERAAPVTKLTLAPGSTRQGVDFALKPIGKVSFRFIDSVTRAPFPASIWVRAYSTAKKYEYYWPDRHVVCSNGKPCEMELPDGQWILLASMDSWPRDHFPTFYPNTSCTEPCNFPNGVVVSAVPGETTPLEFVMTPTGTRITTAGSEAAR